jgi:hypothetical protein
MPWRQGTQFTRCNINEIETWSRHRETPHWHSFLGTLRTRLTMDTARAQIRTQVT